MKKLKKSTINNIISFGIVIVAFIICQSMIASGAMKRSLRGQLVPICVYIVMAISLNLVVGISGELSLGHAGFMSVGAFSGIIAATWLNALFHIDSELLRLILAMIVGGVFAGLAGVLIGCRFGAANHKAATIAGGVILILIGTKVLLEHLGILVL